MNLADFVLLAVVVLGFAVGFFRGTVRAALAVAVWGFCFLVAAYVRIPLGDWLSRNGSLDPFYAQMLAFLAVFFTTFIGLVMLIMVSRTPTSITSHPVVDDIVGGVIGAFAGVLVVAGVVVVLNSYWGVNGAAAAVQFGPLADVQRALMASGIATMVNSTVVHWVAFALGPFIPTEVLAVMA